MIKKIKNENGYAILFTVIIVSAISVITAGISNAIYKQLVLSSLARDSQTAFYQADTASDCALLFDMEVLEKDHIDYPTFSLKEPFPWKCGGVDDVLVTPGPTSYTITPLPENEDKNEPCYRIETTKDWSVPENPKTTILANGYNICNKENLRTVERQIKIVYQ
jgi:hypothetical protein